MLSPKNQGCSPLEIRAYSLLRYSAFIETPLIDKLRSARVTFDWQG